MNPVIFLHGALGASTQLETLRSILEQEGRVAFSMDFSGHHGKPFSKDGFGIEVFASDVLEFMNQNNIARADLFGYSMGGYVAVWLAHIMPERVGQILTLGTKFDWSVESAKKEVQKMDPEKILAKVPAFARLLESRHRPNDWKELLHKTAEMMSGLGKNPLLTEEVFTSIQRPVSILLGDRDDMADRDYSKHVAEILPKGDFELLVDTPHPIENVSMTVLLVLLHEILNK